MLLNDTIITAGEPICSAALKIINFQFGQLHIHEPGARLGEDIEELHQMRVAVRRIRSAYKTLGKFLPFKTSESYSAFLSQKTDFLGLIRNLDVFMMNANLYSDTLDESNQNTFKGLLSVIDLTRRKHQNLLNDYLDSLIFQDFLFGFENLLSQPMYWEGSETPTEEIVPGVLLERFERVKNIDIKTRNYRFRDLHRLRICIKDFRYTLEFFEDILGKDAPILVEDLKRIQDHLGILNDSVDAQRIIYRAILLGSLDQETIETSHVYLGFLEDMVSEKTIEFSKIWDAELLSDWEEKLHEVISK